MRDKPEIPEPDLPDPSLDDDATLPMDPAIDPGKLLREVFPADSVTEKPGDTIGSYKLLQQIGEGGFGVVYMAEQTEPVKRRVALKIIKPGMDTREVIARFEAERQALALMDHPHIARIYDGGTTGTGRPYFVMERVKGVRITEYCDVHCLDTRQRLNIFRDVCSAVQHAHQKGIIHRDLKPSNILVSEREDSPVVKVIDFGIAKAISRELTERTLFTAIGQMIGTPQYMSPEQSGTDGLDIDTRSDIFSLGVVLYEMLTGRTPVDSSQLLGAGFDEIQRIIREQDPPRPSTRLSSLKKEEIAERTRAHPDAPEKLSRLLRGDLDWIVMKALEKDRSRRYATATGFAEDVRRFLNSEPVLASPPSAIYRLRKFARRNRTALATTGVIVSTLIAGTLISLNQMVKAQRAAAESESVLTFFRDRILAAAKPKGVYMGRGFDVTLRHAIDHAEKDIATDFVDQPLAEASIRATLGQTYNRLGEPKAALPQNERAFELRAAHLGPEDPDTLISMSDLANTFDEAGRYEDALPLRETDLKLRKKVFGPEDARTLGSMTNYAGALSDVGRIEEAIERYEESLEIMKRVLGEEDWRTAITMGDLAISLRKSGRIEESLPLREEALELKKKVFGPENPSTLKSMTSLALAYYDVGRYDDALTLRTEVLDLSRQILGPDHSDTLVAMTNLASSLGVAGHREEALKMKKETLALQEKALGPDHPHTLISVKNLAYEFSNTDQPIEAEKLFRRYFTAWPDSKVLGWRFYYDQSSLGAVLADQRKFVKSELLLLSGYEGMKKEACRGFEGMFEETVERLVNLYRAWERPDEVAEWEKKLEELKQEKSDTSKQTNPEKSGSENPVR